MLRMVGDGVLELVQGDVTQQEVDAIVNAANSKLAGGGGVDGAIHRIGGPTILAETMDTYPDGCPTGSAVVTKAGELPSQFVIHAVGPVWNGGDCNEPIQLESAYRRCLEIAAEQKCRSIAFPSISTGAYRFPVDMAAQIALKTVCDWLEENDSPEHVRFVLFSEGAYGAFSEALETLIP